MIRQKVVYTQKLAEYEEKSSKVFKKNGKIKRDFYEKESLKLQYEPVKLQKWVLDNNKRLLVIFEGMDTAGKSSTIKEFNTYLNPREARSVALPKPNSKELGQWYFQHHLKQIPNNIEYEGKDASVITGVDEQIVKLHNKGKYYGKCKHMA